MKKKYIVSIEETISEDFEVMAENIEEAVSLAKKGYKSGDLVLSPGNFQCKKISAYSNDTEEKVEWNEF